ncbi:UDP-glycosyltransferase UGT5-like [Zerene cesonia]|uniref:UDP-glycosyltransferase UGT5-like n=1 Tax=Zerene cesonia TaxID=33412 RepID=UPI0018E581AD|nr:UDP-glycosyltransferase UGT5-like [Zerene cesonia]
MLEDEEVQNLVHSGQKFDLVIVEQFHSDCPLSIAYKLGAPVIGVTSNMLLPWHYTRYGVPYNPSYVLYDIFKAGTKPSFLERVVRTMSFPYINFIQYLCMKADDTVISKFFDDVPPVADLAREIKFLLLYQNYVITGSQILPSNVIEVGGYHVAKPKQLPDDLKKFIDESKNGVIYISFGSVIDPSSLKHERFEAILNAVKELPYRIVWKWNKQIPNKPENIYVSKWMPQNDILAHPNVIAFFSHCGQLGTTEAVHHGVPILGMPVVGDQYSNAAAIEERGLGVQIAVNELTKELLLQKFKIILDPAFRDNVKQLSNMWRDRPVSALSTAIHWTEFAARYHNFTFRPAAADVPLYQYLGLDVIFVLLTFSIFSAFILRWAIFKLIMRLRKVLKQKKD